MVLLAAQLHRQLLHEYENSTRDMLTGLLNRCAFLKNGATEVDRSIRYGHSLAVIFLDLDNFKQINDSRGHDAGDSALQATAKALLDSLRTSDQVARLGGDEFAALLPEIGYNAAIDAGALMASRIELALIDFSPAKVSIGVAWFGRSDRAFPEMLKAADNLMYEAKEGGKGTLRSRGFAESRQGD